VEDRAERKDVAARIRGPALELLRRHVLQRADDGAFLRDLRETHRGLGVRRRPREQLSRFGQAEVEQLHAGLREHHVRGLEIPMDDAAAVRGMQRIRDLVAVAQCLIQRHDTSRQACCQRLALEQFHDEKLDRLP
jgi:hypothetical protein